MDQRLMVTLETEKSGYRLAFHIGQNCPFKLALESLHEFQGQILEWQRVAEERQAALDAENEKNRPEQILT
jgi:hypothetical protein